MSRKVFDKLSSAGGGVIVVVLLLAGGLLIWGHSFANNDVHNQLAQQQIYFPPQSVWKTATKNNTGEIQARMIPYLEKYSGQELLTGPQADAYANHFIDYHLAVMPYGGVYSKVSAAAMTAKPGTTAYTTLHGLETTVFQGTTLRGLLLEAYGFWTIGQVMLYGAIVSFIGAAIMALLVALGFAHAARTSEEKKLFARAGIQARSSVPVA
ncbi:MAG: hypothetical protein ACLP0J_29160 [Solirubrobacteraceae bacterium]